jgi:hypothetical protein
VPDGVPVAPAKARSTSSGERTESSDSNDAVMSAVAVAVTATAETIHTRGRTAGLFMGPILTRFWLMPR